MWKIIYYDSLPSTNATAKQLAVDGAPHGTVVVAGEQTEGRGQYGRVFLSPRGGLYFSVILRPSLPPGELLDLTQRVGVAVCRAVGFGARIKPVNDIRINCKKLCGILVETASTSGKTNYVVAGIGINVAPIGLEVGQEITSLSEEARREVDRQEILNAVLKQLESVFEIDMKEYEALKETPQLQ